MNQVQIDHRICPFLGKTQTDVTTIPLNIGI